MRLGLDGHAALAVDFHFRKNDPSALAGIQSGEADKTAAGAEADLIQELIACGEVGDFVPGLAVLRDFHDTGRRFLDPVQPDLVEVGYGTQVDADPLSGFRFGHPGAVEIEGRKDFGFFSALEEIHFLERPLRHAGSAEAEPV